MNLHLNKDAFVVIISNISNRTSIRTDIIEKDYYITLMLYELSQKQDECHAYFKGGTALYKAIKALKRFSEDIDLTVDVNDCSNSQKKKRIEIAAKKYTSLPRTADKSKEQDIKGSITSVYDYEPIFEIDTNDALQRFSCVKVEATSFTISEPIEDLEIEPILYTSATPQEKEILKSQFNVGPFLIKTIKLERIFADKIFAAEFYYQRNDLFDVSKHLYDVTVLLKLDKIQKLLNDHKYFNQMLNYKREEEKYRIGSDLAGKSFNEFKIFNQLENNLELESNFNKMQEIYVFNNDDVLNYGDVVTSTKKLFQHLQKIDIEFEIKERVAFEFGGMTI